MEMKYKPVSKDKLIGPLTALAKHRRSDLSGGPNSTSNKIFISVIIVEVHF